MSNVLDPQRVMKTLEDGTINEIKKFFPLVGKKHTLIAKDVYIGDPVDIDDVSSQKKARLRGRTWAQGVFADFSLVNNETGKVISTANKLKVLNLPKITRRYSYIVDGTEYQADNQWRLKSGVYARRKANGDEQEHHDCRNPLHTSRPQAVTASELSAFGGAGLLSGPVWQTGRATRRCLTRRRPRRRRLRRRPRLRLLTRRLWRRPRQCSLLRPQRSSSQSSAVPRRWQSTARPCCSTRR